MKSEGQGQKIKRKIGTLAREIHRNMAGTLSDELWFDQCRNTINHQDQNKLALMHFINMRVETMLEPKSAVVSYQTPTTQLCSLKKIRKLMRGSADADYFDLEKSFIAYRSFYPAYEVAPLNRISYGIFQDVRDTRLGRKKEKFEEEIEPEELLGFKNQLDDLLNRAGDYVTHDCKDTLVEFKFKTTEIFSKMDENKDKLYATASFANNSKTSLQYRHKAAYVFGYTAFALAHLTEDKHIPFEKRCFLIEQTDRVLHYLAQPA